MGANGAGMIARPDAEPPSTSEKKESATAADRRRMPENAHHTRQKFSENNTELEAVSPNDNLDKRNFWDTSDLECSSIRS